MSETFTDPVQECSNSVLQTEGRKDTVVQGQEEFGTLPMNPPMNSSDRKYPSLNVQLTCQKIRRKYMRFRGMKSSTKIMITVNAKELGPFNTKLKTVKGTISNRTMLGDFSKEQSCILKPSLTQQSTGQKSYQCNHCGQAFSAGRSLRQHVRIHTIGKPYQCNQCDKKYKTQPHLTRHLKTHSSSAKPHRCNECHLLKNIF